MSVWVAYLKVRGLASWRRIPIPIPIPILILILILILVSGLWLLIWCVYCHGLSWMEWDSGWTALDWQ